MLILMLLLLLLSSKKSSCCSDIGCGGGGGGGDAVGSVWLMLLVAIPLLVVFMVAKNKGDEVTEGCGVEGSMTTTISFTLYDGCAVV